MERKSSPETPSFAEFVASVTTTLPAIEIVESVTWTGESPKPRPWLTTARFLMGHPLRAAYWLARILSERDQSLKAGEMTSSGSLGPVKSEN